MVSQPSEMGDASDHHIPKGVEKDLLIQALHSAPQIMLAIVPPLADPKCPNQSPDACRALS